jgi:uncharacterized protein
MKRVMVDSGALLALVNSRDKYHLLAAQFVREYADCQYIVPETIFVETMVLTKARLGSEAALMLGERLRESHHFVVEALTTADKALTWQIFSRYADKDWSYVDCSIWAMGQRLNITQVFSFDQHLAQMVGIQRVPVVL